MSRGLLVGKSALIIGGAGGVGRASSLLFAAEGAQVAIADVQIAAGEAVTAEIRAASGEALFVEADVSSKVAVDAAVEHTLAEFEKIDILFNHAGTVIVRPFLDMTEDEWDRLMATNVKSMFFACKAVLPHMLAVERGVIVNTASISGFTASPLESAYCATKGAVLQLTRAIALEFRDRGIRCNALCPGFIRTDHGVREMNELEEQGIDITRAISESQGRVCEPEEVASAALFLASDESSFVNGAALTIDNGSTVLT